MKHRLFSSLRYMPPLEKHDFQPVELFPEEATVYGKSCIDINGSFFHSILYTQLPSPPLGPFDPCFRKWADSTFFAYMLQLIGNIEPQTTAFCTAVREQYLDASRDYADALLQHWGHILPAQVKYLWQVDGPIPYMTTQKIVSTATS